MSHTPRIFIDQPLTAGERLALPADKAHHLNTVLRLGESAPVLLFNDDGHEYAAKVALASRNAVEVDVTDVHSPERESPLQITLAQGIARGDRMDFAIAKAVELGVNHIRPLFCERGKVKLAGNRLDKKQTHWQRVAESAAEQSGRLIRPRVQSAMTGKQFLAGPAGGLGLILAPEAGSGLASLEPAYHITVIAGPESGFSDSEIKAARQAGYRPLQLGPRTLRTETAGMAALAAIQGRWGDLA